MSDAYSIPLKDKSFDLVMGVELLEHLSQPGEAIKELIRVSRGFVLVTVPNEPFFTTANILRLKYLRQLGRTPGHVQSWNRDNLSQMLRRQFSTVMVKSPTLWLIALCKI